MPDNVVFKKFKKKPLPRSLYTWIKAAAEDAKQLEQTPGFVLNMNTYNNIRKEWSEQEESWTLDRCHVCLGGACIVGRGLIAPGAGTGNNANSTSYAVAHALDNVRTGEVTAAAEYLLEHGLIGRLPSRASMLAAGRLINRRFRYSLDRAPWDVYIKAAELVKRKH